MKLPVKFMSAVVFLLSGAMTLGAAWTTRRLTNNTGTSYVPSIAARSSNIYVAWYDDTPGNEEIYFKKSADGGATWQTTKRLTDNSENSSYPRIAVSDSNVYVVWQDETPGNGEIYFRKSADYGATWQTAKRLTNNTQESGYPWIAASDSNVYVVWGDCASGNWEIYFRKSTDCGATWQTARMLTNNCGGSYCPVIAVNSLNVYVVWYDDTPGNSEIYFKKSADGGTTWQTTKRLTNTTGNSYDPRVAVRGANVYVVWYDDTLGGDDEVYFRKSTDGGAAWQAAMRLTNTASSYYSGYPALAAYTSNIYVVYESDAPGNPEIYFKKSGDGGTTWPTTQKLTNNADWSYYPDIALAGGNIYVVWADETSGNFEIYVKYSPLL